MTLEEINFENLIIFYEEELKRIVMGETSSNILSEATRKKMVKLRILICYRKRGRKYKVSPEALAVLQVGNPQVTKTPENWRLPKNE